MNLHRIFIAINLPDNVKQELLGYQNQWPELPAKWVAPKNLHMTLAFLGNTSTQELANICTLLQPVGERHQPFSVTIRGITYGPSTAKPRMIWARVEKSPKLSRLQQDIVQATENGNIHAFSPHLTLARLRMFQLQRIEPEEMPSINEETALSFTANSFEIMESELKRSGAIYTVVQSISLQNHNSTDF